VVPAHGLSHEGPRQAVAAGTTQHAA
jgi:hypothetical protein